MNDAQFDYISGRVLVGTLWFAILIVTSSYTANMAAYFTFSKSLSESENIESLLKEGVSFSLRKTTALDQYLQNSDYKVYKLLSERITQQQKYVKDVLEGIAKVKEDPNLLFIGEGPYAEWLINKGDCNLKMGKLHVTSHRHISQSYDDKSFIIFLWKSQIFNMERSPIIRYLPNSKSHINSNPLLFFTMNVPIARKNGEVIFLKGFFLFLLFNYSIIFIIMFYVVYHLLWGSNVAVRVLVSCAEV